MTRLLLVVFLTANPFPPLTFCDGYRQGFMSGYCWGSVFCTRGPVPTPACPRQEGTWRDGYERGWDDGEKERRR